MVFFIFSWSERYILFLFSVGKAINFGLKVYFFEAKKAENGNLNVLQKGPFNKGLLN